MLLRCLLTCCLAPLVAVEAYRQDFSAAAAVPAELMVLTGEFAPAADGTNKVLALTPLPLDTCTLLFGPTATSGLGARLRVKGTSKGRQAPTFGVGLGGVSGLLLRLAGTKQTLELVQDDQVLASAPLTWTSGTWTWLALRLRADGAAWQVEGKAWADGAAEPATWTITHRLEQAPPSGRPSAWGIPYGGQPLWFDDLQVEEAK